MYKRQVLGEVLVSFVGRYSVTIENYRGILIYDDKTVKLQAKHCKLQIHGKRLHIDYYNHDEMKDVYKRQAWRRGAPYSHCA